jgi:hypothetical protein
VAYVKKANKCLVENSFGHQKLSFLHRPWENNIFRDTLCPGIECGEVHPEFFFGILEILKYVFFAIGASTSMSQIGFPW